MAYDFPNGLGQSLGNSLVTGKPLRTSGDVWFVHAGTGSDSYNGRDSTKPLATLGQAYTNAAANDIIVLKDGHTETRTSLLTVAKAGLVIVGGGSSGGKPTVKLTNNSAAAGLLDFTAAGTELRNVWIEENAQTNAVARVRLSSGFHRITECYFECGATDTGTALHIAAENGALIENTTFISTATALTAQPLQAIYGSHANSISHLHMRGVTVSGGTHGFSEFYAVEFEDGGAGLGLTRFKIESLSLLLGADLKIDSASSGFLNVATATGNARVNW